MARRALIAIVISASVVACAGRSPRIAAEAPTQPAWEQTEAAELEGVIVPGRRVGRVTLGMSEAVLHQILGRPLQTDDAGAHRIQEFGELSVVLERRTRTVEMVVVPGVQFRTEQGISVGSTQSAVRAAYGRPAKQTGDRSTFLTACYGHGLVLNYRGDVVENIVVRTPGC